MENKNIKIATRLDNAFKLEQFVEDRGIYEFVRWFDSGVLDLKPDFQRSYKWTKKQASELIESFLLGLPVPNIFLYKDGHRRIVIDGVQRLTTIIKFFKNEWTLPNGKTEEFTLDFREDRNDQSVEDYRFQGKTIDTLSDEDKHQLNNFSGLRVTTIKQENPDNTESIYYLFERLNTGGTKLTPMEILNSIYRGKFLDKIKDVARQNETFKALIRKRSTKKDEPDDDTIYEEVLLRIFAFYDDLELFDNKTTLTKFLNTYCNKNRNPDDKWIDERITLFNNAINNNDFVSLLKSIMKAKNNGVLESFFVVFFRNQSCNLQKRTELQIKELINSIPKSATYSRDSISKRITALEGFLKNS